MHPFCCSSPVPVSPTTTAPPSSLPPMPPPPPPLRSKPSPEPVTSTTTSTSAANGFRSASATHHRNSSSNCNANSLLDHREVRLNDIVGNGISGILQKWVNYGKGWRPRWFVLQDGVLSYYKIHGPDKIEVNQETEKGSKVIGDESMRRVSRQRNGHSLVRPKPFGEVHLKVSTIRESRSDDKRFSIFTGTKRLHLRAETREDRAMWMEALQAVKEMFPRISNSELMAPVDNFVVSTEKLRQRLMEEGMSEAAIQDSEQIMRNEFAALQTQLMLLKQKQAMLIDTLRQLEV